jgi:hypothetical protein
MQAQIASHLQDTGQSSIHPSPTAYRTRLFSHQKCSSRPQSHPLHNSPANPSTNEIARPARDPQCSISLPVLREQPWFGLRHRVSSQDNVQTTILLLVGLRTYLAAEYLVWRVVGIELRSHLTELLLQGRDWSGRMQRRREHKIWEASETRRISVE